MRRPLSRTNSSKTVARLARNMSEYRVLNAGLDHVRDDVLVLLNLFTVSTSCQRPQELGRRVSTPIACAQTTSLTVTVTICDNL